MRSTRTRTRWPAVLAGAALLVPMAGIAPSSADDDTDKIAPQLLAELDQEGSADFWIHFGDRPDLAGARSMTDWDARGWAVYTALTTTADASQAGARQQLDAAGADYRSYFISNAIRVTGGDAELATALAADPEVDGVYPTFEVQAPDPTLRAADDHTPAAIEWGVTDINADDVWAAGHTGEGIVVGSIDTGVQYNHPALVEQYRGNDGDGTFTHDYNWFDAAGASPAFPTDGNGHGTHTTGTMVGDDGGANRIGVAPGATWIAANGCCPSDAALLDSMEWMLAPTDLAGANADPTKRPHVINNSWGTIVPSDAPFGEESQEAWADAGIFGVFANGNSGPGCNTSGSPGSRILNYSVGNYTASHVIAASSARGSGQDGEIKPNISAPGSNVRSALPGSGYGSGTGTSMAAPHVAGSVALLWSASPGLVGDIGATRALLDGTAIDTANLTCGGSAADNNVFGEGRLDVMAAVEDAPGLAVVRVSGPNRYATAVEISQDYAPGVDVVFVATGANFPDALAVAPLAGRNDAPVLLTSPTQLPEVVEDELTRLMPDRVVVLGGPAAVSSDVFDDIDAATGTAPMVRVQGTNRYETAELVSQYFTAPDTVFVATGTNFPDALAAGPVGTMDNAPVLLTKHDELPDATIDALLAIGPDTIRILGGTGAVSAGVQTELAGYATTVERVEGADRYATAALLSAELPMPDPAYVASGQNWPDALAGAARAGRDGSPVLLVRQDSVPAATWTALEAMLPLSTIYLLGGTAAVSEGVKTELETLD